MEVHEATVALHLFEQVNDLGRNLDAFGEEKIGIECIGDNEEMVFDGELLRRRCPFHQVARWGEVGGERHGWRQRCLLA